MLDSILISLPKNSNQRIDLRQPIHFKIHSSRFIQESVELRIEIDPSLVKMIAYQNYKINLNPGYTKFKITQVK